VPAWSPALFREWRTTLRIRKVAPKRALVAQIADLQRQILELRLSVSEAKLRALVDEVVAVRAKEIGTLTDHAVKALRLLIKAGVITQAEANEVIR